MTTTPPAASAASPADNHILTDPRLSRVVLRLAWPVFVSRLLHTLFHLANVAWMGQVGPAAIAAVTTSIFVMWTVHSLADMLAIGATSLVAQRIGAGDRRAAAATAGQGFFAAVMLGVAIAIAGIFGAGPLFRLITDDAAVSRAGATYLRFVTAVAPATLIIFLGESVFRGAGNTRTPMRVLLGTLVINIVLDPLLILGLGPLPRLGVLGAAIATAAAQCVGAAIYLVLFLRRRGPFPLGEMFRGFRPERAAIREMAGIGAPIALIGILFSVVYIGLSKIAAGYGTPILAALGVVNRIEGFSYLTAQGFSVAATTSVGQNIGAGQVERADRMARMARRWSVAITGLYGLIFLILAGPILRLFTDDTTVLTRGVLFLQLVATAQPFMGIDIALEGALAGAGDTRPAMLIAVPLSLVRLPLIVWLAGPMGIGAAAIWWVITITAIVRGIILEIWFRAGHWKRRHRPLLTALEPHSPAAD